MPTSGRVSGSLEKRPPTERKSRRCDAVAGNVCIAIGAEGQWKRAKNRGVYTGIRTCFRKPQVTSIIYIYPQDSRGITSKRFLHRTKDDIYRAAPETIMVIFHFFLLGKTSKQSKKKKPEGKKGGGESRKMKNA